MKLNIQYTFVIVHVQDRDLYWSNAHGWVEFIGADEFKYTDGYRLPIDGRWMAIAVS